MIPLVYLNLAGMLSLPQPLNLSPYIQFVLSLSILIINRTFFVRGVRGVINKAPGMDTLISLGAGAAFIYSTCLVIRNIVVTGSFFYTSILNNYNPSSMGNHKMCMYYFESAGMIFTLITLGKMLEKRSKDHTMDAINGLSRLVGSRVTVLRDGEERIITPEAVRVSDVVYVKAGDAIPADGKVIWGSGSLDKSALTGESLPEEVSVGTEVLSGCMCLEGFFKFEVTGAGEDTTLSHIIELVKEAAGKRAPIQMLADRISGYFVPIVTALSLITLLVWLAMGKDFSTAIGFSISVLVISCPCALGLATPVSMMAATGNAASHGVLIRSAQSLEILKDVNAVVLDKTGTITTGTIGFTGNKEGNDEIKEDSVKAVKEFNELGIETIMATGDRKEIAGEIATRIGVDRVFSEILPGDKHEIVASLQKEGKKVAMIGDGINDAPALMKADVGMAIGKGSDIAVDSADFILMKNSLMDAVYAVKLSRRTIKIIKENLFWAFFYNVIGIPVAAGALVSIGGPVLTPGIAAACMSLSSLFVVTNAYRLRREK